ncbi:formate dehydrogenase accessory sulfurtransferase FdhD [Ilyobacter polytropus]|uniref:Formate dehydrogenase family accessory protein FdhD n=1 Tax=Ilyobacter polytropus (strain ATCC 51220 / DSM 2926 / LMG 16218 / CuHBu1) TaxID=572544 RepID=E3H6Q5_ILYPC|nr:formate dehydrogenase accessory sulfurtransferase FdhD [Ilyobacter polytropus]ADO82424.1 formate dehydrogenase family accessory protein FdhD [Ilyobacter polytropus DSM 2926]
MRKSNVFTEEAVELFVNGKKMITFMCTPENLDEMALGYLYSRGIIECVDEFMGAAPCSSGKRIFAIVSKKLKDEVYSIKNIVMSGCGSGELPKELDFYKRDIRSGYRVEMGNIKETFGEMLESARLHQTTGGTHSAAIKDNEGRVIVREDIGRHNAVDKVIGAALLEGMNLERSTVVITGRVSSDMVVKAAGAGVPVVASMRITSNMAIEIANKYKVNLIGRIGSNEPLIYNEVEGTYIER